MTIYNRPDASVPVWAESGDKVQPTNPEVQTGWPLSTTPPSRQRFNWLQNFLANGLRYLLQRGVPEWAADESYAIGSRVQYSGLTYVALTDNTNQQPDTNADDWERWGFTLSELIGFTDAYLSKSVAGNSNVTLSASEARAGIINLTGALTGNIQVIVPATAKRTTFINSTSGAYTITVKTSGGTGVVLQQGSSSSLYCDGANVDFSVKSGATPAQFDSTTRIATMEAVQRALGNIRGVDAVTTTPYSLTAANAGNLVYASSGASVINLPAASSVKDGTCFIIQAASITLTINRAGSDTIYLDSTGQTSVTLAGGDSICLVSSSGSNGWFSPYGSTRLGKSSAFGSSLAASGYQKLPSGLIIQWGGNSGNASAGVTVNFPIAFPNACLSLVGSVDGSFNYAFVRESNPTTTQFVFGAYNTSNVRTTQFCRWVAIGY